MRHTFHGTVSNGKFHVDDRSAFNQTLGSFEGKQLTVTLERKRSIRSRNQNDWYWSVVLGLFAEHCGYEPDELHEALKWRFLKIHTDKGLEMCRSTTDLSTVEFTQYVDRVRQLAAEMGCVIPDPDRG